MNRKFFSIVLAALLVAGLTSFAFAADEISMYQGLGKSVNFRVGPGSDSEGVQVYSINYVYATGLFDEEGRIVSVYLDALEISTPNYDGASMPHFSGWPGTEGYNVTDHESGKVVGVSENTVEAITAEVNNWQTKRERGTAYGMNPWNEWDQQMDNFQELFVGMTVDEVEEWFARYCSDRNGRPLNPSTTNEADKAKVDKLTDAEKEMLVDVRTGATMSLNDSHGDLIAAIRDAYENRVQISIPAN